jgi:hypothetical protein
MDQQKVVMTRDCGSVSQAGHVGKVDDVGWFGRVRRRFGRGGLAAGVVVVLVAAGGVAFAGDGGSSRSRGVLVVPGVDGEGVRGSAVRYLVGRGMSVEAARRRMVNQSVALRAVAELRRRAPGGVGSVWLDEGGDLWVRVLDEVAEREARAVGAAVVFGTFAAGDLEVVRDRLADDVVRDPPVGLSGATFEIDEAGNRVVARYLFEEPGGVVPEAAVGLGGLVTASAEVASIRSQADVYVAGARMSSSSTKTCTAGWAVDIPVAGGGVPKNGVMTAGHCFRPYLAARRTKYNIDTTAAGDTPATGVLYEFGERGDYGVLELDNGDRGRTTMADTLHVVEAVQEPVEGVVVCKDGTTTAQTCGEITRVNVSFLVDADVGNRRALLRGMTRVSYCAELGDSGAPVFAEFDEGRSVFAVAAIGIHSADVNYPDAEGNHVCGEKVSRPNEAYFTPLSGIDTEGRFSVRIENG